jgi:hypothetical protein
MISPLQVFRPEFCMHFSSLATSSLLCPDIDNTLFYNSLSLYSSLSVRDQVSRPYKTTDEIIVTKYSSNVYFFYKITQNIWINDAWVVAKL